MILLDTTTVATGASSVPSFGIFEQLANYGALGLAVLALGAVGWFLLKRQMDNADYQRRRLEELEKENRQNKS